jgi:hypothetical protein
MKNTQTAAMYIGVGAILTLILLFLMGRLRTERYEESFRTELENLLQELAQDAPMKDEMEMTATGPSMDYDSDDE